ncbi:MAG: hypothetical protein KBE65_02405 [Phycisphaerae bacterium]|nr:hypothetical protein [Phycisphaerae bacterium]
MLFGGMMIDALGTPQAIRATAVQTAWSGGFVAMIFWSAHAAFFIGLLSPFYSNLTKAKRVFLLLVSLLPGALAALSLAVVPSDFRGWMIGLGVIGCMSGGLINVPPIVLGIHFVDFVQWIARKLRLVSNDSSPQFGD